MIFKGYDCLIIIFMCFCGICSCLNGLHKIRKETIKKDKEREFWRKRMETIKTEFNKNRRGKDKWE